MKTTTKYWLLHSLGLMLFLNYPSFSQQPVYFDQGISRKITLPERAGKNVLQLFARGDSVLMLTSHGLFTYYQGSWSGKPYISGLQFGAMDPSHQVWLSNGRSIWSEGGKKIPNPPLHSGESITCLAWADTQTLLAGSSRGLFVWNGEWNLPPALTEISINSLAIDSDGSWWVAGNKGLWRHKNEIWANMDRIVMAPGHESRYMALEPTASVGSLYFSSAKAVGKLAESGDNWLAKGSDGLPYGPVTRIVEKDGVIWMATAKGLIKKDGDWQYFSGKRWLPDDRVQDILAIGNKKVWVATPQGIVEIGSVQMSLEEKADSLEHVLEARHNRLGLINRSKLAIPGELSSSFMENEDNDGLWTSCYLIAQCYRFAVTRDETARERAVRTFEALERLETVTGIYGYPARSYARAADLVAPSRSPHPKNWHLSADGQWQWLDDTSSDEIVGHLFSLALFHELVANDSQQKQVVALIDRIVGHIVDHEFQLIDADGLPTRWGIWNPDSLNRSSNWMYERGLNSLQILSHLKTAYHFTGKQKYEIAYRFLVEKEGYAVNAFTAKMTDPFEISHSDDILNFFPYHNLFRYTPKEDPSYPLYLKSLRRSWEAVRSDRMPVWNILSSSLLGEALDLEIAQQILEDFPLDQVNWSYTNSHRWDIKRDEFPGRGGVEQALVALNPGESNVSRWNTNPKQLDGGGKGLSEESGSFYLLAYWMGRYYGYW
ncbi:transcriptional regulator [Cyclobacterium sp.]|uniref:transcriptional regulator n=1 Tax=Cyclobacterium sp. TaxID=1966343 RepID=UPI0025B7CAAD|nr:transcriptional regulator [Cyclobacterium sp.]